LPPPCHLDPVKLMELPAQTIILPLNRLKAMPFPVQNPVVMAQYKFLSCVPDALRLLPRMEILGAVSGPPVELESEPPPRNPKDAQLQQLLRSNSPELWVLPLLPTATRLH